MLDLFSGFPSFLIQYNALPQSQACVFQIVPMRRYKATVRLNKLVSKRREKDVRAPDPIYCLPELFVMFLITAVAELRRGNAGNWA